MRTSQFLITTLKETPADAELISHKLMLRAGLIRKLAAGLYTWLPLGYRVLRNVEKIVREEMNRAGAQEMLMPAVQPAELWQETGRWEQFGPQLLCMKDRHKRDYCFGPTHEEVITDFVRGELKSYKQLPCTFYQIQMKFRDEIRPRFGVMRAREFLMKDAYSFDLDAEGLQKSYDKMHAAYDRIFTRLGLTFRVVLADTGAIGGSGSQEFHVLADSGEDVIVYSDGGYAANMELATAAIPPIKRAEPTKTFQKQSTPNIRAVPEQAKALGLPVDHILKTILVKGADDPVVALIVKGDDTLNPIKAEKLPEVAVPFELIDEATLLNVAGCTPGFVGPIGLNIPIIVDHLVMGLSDFSCGANQDDWHHVGVNWDRDLPLPAKVTDLRKVKEGDLSPDGEGTLKVCRGIEVGHIFQLGSKYSQAMQATVLNKAGKQHTLEMGCYGIGVSRIVAAAIEQHHDENGIIWPNTMAPFQFVIIPMQYDKSEAVRQKADALMGELEAAGFSVLLDDRNERPGVMFAESELIGIPHRWVVGEKGLAQGTLEYKNRKTGEVKHVPIDDVLSFCKEQIKI